MKVFYIFFLALFSIQALGADIAVSSYPWQKTSITEMLADFKKIGVKKSLDVSKYKNWRERP